ncbi:MAG: sugar MFS transporter [Caulobacterales bacterium]|nr:sugar MFS transporter [Caulobacterales bacterium]
MALFFAFGFCTVLVDTLVPKLKAVFSLSYTEVMLTQFCYFLAYFLVSGPAGWLITKVGYLRGVTIGVLVMALGCLLFTPAADAGSYPAFLGALFILASGVTIVQVAANPLAATLGDPAKAHSRLTLAQAFNSVATMVGPLFGAALILSHVRTAPPRGLSPAMLGAFRRAEAQSLQAPFLGIAAVLLLLALVCWSLRKRTPPAPRTEGGSLGRLLRNRRLMLGALSIFAYVGAEVAIGSAIANYLMSPRVLGAAPQTAGSLVSVYWGLAMCGRFIGVLVLRKAPPGLVLAGCASGAALLALTSALTAGPVAAAAILAVGLFNSIMFPTIFTLALEGLEQEAAQGSGLICQAIVGGAVVPLAFGFAADHVGINLALFVPVACYAWIIGYGILAFTGAFAARKPARLGEALV